MTPPPIHAEPPAGQPIQAAGIRPWTWVLLLASLGALVVLWRVRPEGQAYFPKCYMYVVTGVKCPGCGVLRATHALLNGEFAIAWRLNPFWVTSLPLLGWTALAVSGERWRGWKLPNPLLRPWGIGAYVGLAMAYGLVRNLSLIPGLD